MTTTKRLPTKNPLMTPAEAARALRVTPRTVYLWIKAGKLPAIHVSERVTRIPAGEVERLLAGRGTSPPPPALTSVLWDLDPAQIDFDVHARLIIERILEAGRPAQVRWLFQRYPLRTVLDVAEHSRALTRRSAVAWSTLLRDRMDRAA
jgi:excisionase family DNA binding protein